MFSGIIEEIASVRSITHDGEGARIVIMSALDHADTKLGDSIAINGVCLTVVEKDGGNLSFDAVSETLRRTDLGSLQSGSKVNLERSLKVGERIHGHFVFGHCDSVVKLISSFQEGTSVRLTFDLPNELRQFITSKGSVTVSGVSLTVGEVTANNFSVYIIPHTASMTTLGALELGGLVNIEVDMLARYVHSLTKGEV